ncbi:hypothetical protein GGF43_002391 [Coemansia sp. RSA 2618]|nr:hypothetical protein GGF43_002391 [Coemansia sp. RSA 2618]
MQPGSEPQFILRYFNIVGRAEASRLLLTAGKASWTEENPEWPAAKADQPFGRLPVLVERTSGRDDWILSESHTIERYLARTFNLLPTDLKQAAEQEQMADQEADVVNAFFMQVLASGDHKQRLVDEFNSLFARMVAEHMRILGKNKSKAHLFGDALTYGDIGFYVFYKLFTLFLGTYQSDIAEITKAKVPAELVELIASIEKEPLLAAHLEKCDSVAAFLSA